MQAEKSMVERRGGRNERAAQSEKREEDKEKDR